MNLNMSNYYISSDHNKLDIERVWLLLKDCFWSKNIPIECVEKFVQHSLCFGAYMAVNDQLVGFGRVISDFTTYAYVCDVIIDEGHRHHGLATKMLDAMFLHPSLQNLKTWSLKTTDEARKIYQKKGFRVVAPAESQLELDDLGIYFKGK
jgi:ribosomal protein S18 acetylase RimI-like enzyme